MSVVDSRSFRTVMGQFATGVTVITLNAGGRLRGMTANSFTSVSLDPPLLLVCVDRHASLHDLIDEAGGFAVNILAEDQIEVSRIFAARGEHNTPMAGVPHRLSGRGAPILDGVIAWVDCRVEHTYPGGDHTIVVGRVESMGMERPEAPPLVFAAGQYRLLGDVR